MNYYLDEETINRFFEKIKSLILPSKENNYKSIFLQSNTLLYFVVLLFVLKITTTLISINIPQNIFFADITEFALENSVNQTRQSLGLKTLIPNEKLDQAAQLKAENMVQNNYFNHTSPSGISPWFWFTKAGYVYKYAGENLAIGFFDSQEVYNAWLNSPSHKANIINPNYTEVGTAVLKGFGVNNSIVVVQEFGSRISAKTTTVKNTNPKPAPVPTPVATTNTQTPIPNTNEQVLSQTTEMQSSIITPTTGVTGLPAKATNFVLYNYDGILKNITYGVSLVVIGILFTLIFFNFNIKFKKQLVFRAVLIIALLSVATLVNKEVIIALIPHQVII